MSKTPVRCLIVIIFMKDLLFYIIIFIAAINLIALFVMLSDKIRSAKPGARRVPEINLFLLAALFGGLGIYAGMFVFRHKTRKWYFLIGIPVLIIGNVVAVYLAYQFLLTHNLVIKLFN